MLLTLTDHLTCPSCGPAAGLILLMEEADDRRVRTGALGCPVCRARYGIVEGVADLRVPSVGAGGSASAEAGVAPVAGGRDLAIRVAALTGLGDTRGFVLVDGAAAPEVAAELAGLLADQEMVVPIPEGRRSEPRRAPVSSLLESGSLPIGTRTMAAAAYVGGVPGEARVRELLRVTRPTGRVVIQLGGVEEGGASLDRVADLLEAAGAPVRARDATGLVAVVL